MVLEFSGPGGGEERLLVTDGGHRGAAAGRQPGVQPAEDATQVRMRLSNITGLRSCRFGDCLYWKLLSEDTTCLPSVH